MDAWGAEECQVVLDVEGKTPQEVAMEVADEVHQFLNRVATPEDLPVRGGSIV